MPTPSLATVGGLQFGPYYAGEYLSDNPEIDDRINESATAIDLGAPVCRGVATTPGVIGNCKPPVSAGVVIGISGRQASEANTDTVAGVTALVNYKQNKTVPVFKDGYIACLAAENVTEGDACIAIVAGAGMGGTTGGAADGTTRLAFAPTTAGAPFAFWAETVTSGNVGKVHIKAPL